MTEETPQQEASTPQAVFAAALAHLFMNMMDELERAYREGESIDNEVLGDLVVQVKEKVLAIYAIAFGEEAEPLV